MEPSTKIRIIYGRKGCATISKMRQVFQEVDGSHGWVKYRIRISFVVCKNSVYLSTHEIIVVSNQNNDGAKATKQDLSFMEQLQKILNYYRKFEQEYNVKFSVSRIRDIVEYMKASK